MQTKWCDADAEESEAFIDGLHLALVWVEGEMEGFQVILDLYDVFFRLVILGFRDDDDKIVHVATVVLIAELELDEAV